MVIEALTLYKFNRFKLLGIDKMTYTPKSVYQLFTGKNGIGKSSLLYEISPLPCESTDLAEAGYKEIKLNHRGKQYVIKYTMERKLNCSFICNGEELNLGRTISAQRNLIWEHFQYDDNIHDVLVGNTLLTNMPPQVRREWFMRMSKSDMNYAIALYNRIRTAERDIRGAIKLNNQRLVAEQAKLPSQEEIDQAKRLTAGLKQELNHLLPFTVQYLDDKRETLIQLGNDIQLLSEQIINYKYNLVYKEMKEVNMLKQFAEHLKWRQDTYTNDYHKALNQLVELQDIYNRNKTITEKPLSEIDDEIRHVREVISQAIEKYRVIGMEVGDNVDEQLLQFEKCSVQVGDILKKLPRNYFETDEPRYTIETKEGLFNKLNSEKARVIKLENQLNYLTRELQNIQDIHHVDCPSCHHRFKPGVNECRVTELEKEIEEKQRLLELAHGSVNTLAEMYKDHTFYFTCLKELSQCREQYPDLRMFFKHLGNSVNFHRHPALLLNLFNPYHEALVVKQTQLQYEQTLKELEEARIRRVAAEGSDNEYILKTMSDLENQVEKLQLEMNQCQQECREVDLILKDHELFNTRLDKLNELLKRYRQTTVDYIRYQNNNKVKQLINEKQNVLATSEIRLNQLTQSETVIRQLEETKVQLAEEHQALQVLTTLLSPTDGLIAETMMGFLHQFLNEMANVIEHIWSYGMRPYMELTEDGVDLDYRFKVDIEGVDSPVKDVSRLSRGQKEIMDFVFKLLLMQHLDLQDYPLFMDEIGGSFDPYHRDKLYKYIKLLAESQQTQQVFIISHIAQSHDALQNADRCVLDRDAVLIDETVNHVLSFE